MGDLKLISKAEHDAKRQIREAEERLTGSALYERKRLIAGRRSSAEYMENGHGPEVAKVRADQYRQFVARALMAGPQDWARKRPVAAASIEAVNAATVGLEWRTRTKAQRKAGRVDRTVYIGRIRGTGTGNWLPDFIGTDKPEPTIRKRNREAVRVVHTQAVESEAARLGLANIHADAND